MTEAKKKKIDQEEKVADYAQGNGSINEEQATSIGVKRLSAVINKLRNKHWVFKTVKYHVEGAPTATCKYVLEHNPTITDQTPRIVKIQGILDASYPEYYKGAQLAELFRDCLVWCNANKVDMIEAIGSAAKKLNEENT